MKAANILVLQGNIKVPSSFFYLDCTVQIWVAILTIFNFLFFNFFSRYLLHLQVINSRVIFLGPQCKVLGVPVIVTAIRVLLLLLVRDSEPIRLLKSPRLLSVYILITLIIISIFTLICVAS